MTPELTARRVNVTERGPASRLLEKVELKKYVGKRFDGEGPSKKVCGRRSTGEGLLEKVCGRRAVGEGPRERVYRKRGMPMEERDVDGRGPVGMRVVA